MSGMVERVARAIWQVAVDPDVGGATWKTFVPAAREIIAEMREPTEAMFMRGGHEPVSNRGDDRKTARLGRRIGDHAARDTWRAMIDAALAEGQ